VGCVGVTDRCSFLIIERGARFVPQPWVQGEPWRAGDGRPSSRGVEWPQTMADRLGDLAGQSSIFANGAPAPLVTSLAASKSFSMFVNVTKEHDMTLAGGASFNGGIFLAVAAVDKALKGSMAGERMNKRFGREVWEKEMS
jgi:hypothetical protein